MVGIGHMYITERELKVRWLIVTTTMPSLSSFDVVVHRPDSTPLGNVGAVYLESYNALATSAGYTISYTFTPDVPGVWSVKLSIGSSDNYQILKIVNLTIHDSDKDIFQQVTLSVLPEEPEPLPINLSLSDTIEFSSELSNDNTLDLTVVFVSTTPYPYIPDKDIIVFGAELSSDNRMFPNPPKLDDFIFGAEVAGINTLTQVVVNKNTGRDELIFGAEIAGVNTITSSLPPRNIVLSTPDTLGFSSEIAGTNTLDRVILEHNVGSDSLVFDSAINTSSVNTLTTI